MSLILLDVLRESNLAKDFMKEKEWVLVNKFLFIGELKFSSEVEKRGEEL